MQAKLGPAQYISVKRVSSAREPMNGQISRRAAVRQRTLSRVPVVAALLTYTWAERRAAVRLRTPPYACDITGPSKPSVGRAQRPVGECSMRRRVCCSVRLVCFCRFKNFPHCTRQCLRNLSAFRSTAFLLCPCVLPVSSRAARVAQYVAAFRRRFLPARPAICAGASTQQPMCA